MTETYTELINKYFEELKGLIKKKKLKEDFIYGENEIELTYLNQVIKIDILSMKFNKDINDKEKVIILRYLCKFPYKKSDELITFKSLPEGNFYFPSIYSRIYLPLIKKYGKEPEKFVGKSIEIGAERFNDFSVKFNIFSDVFFIFDLIPEDDEFPADLRILFNKTTSEIFEIEDIAIIGEIIVSKIT
ncbi:MAG TPA: DUF3786 domain-containing protein [bacterium]|nr:DUF3786 domain-containing protein [bacterium]HOM27018.1 DUF3786 domain-containing protein [bacterium]